MIQKFRTKGVAVRCLIAAVLSLIYALVSGPFLLHLIDGLSIASVLLLFAGILVYWWKDGFFTFFSWKREDGPLTQYREKAREERRNAENPALYAGLILFVISLLLSLLYSVII